MNRVWFGHHPPDSEDRWEHAKADMTVLALESAIEGAEELWIADPLMFPWDTIGRSLPMPVTVDISGHSLLELAGVAPCLETLSPGDRIISEDPFVATHLRQLVDTDNPAHDSLPERQRAKSIDTLRSDTISRIEQEASYRGDRDRLVTIAITRDEIVTAEGEGPVFPRVLGDATAGLGAGNVVEVFGLRAEPGDELAGCVIGYVLDEPPVLQENGPSR